MRKFNMNTLPIMAEAEIETKTSSVFEDECTHIDLDHSGMDADSLEAFHYSPIEVECKEDEDTKKPPPPDIFNIIYFLLFFLGLTSLMTTQYIFGANDFWMWKFRNISRPWKGAGDAQHRTYLQASVFSFIAVATAIPSLVSLALIVILVQKTTTRARITACYGIYIGIYGSFFVLAIIDTDQWQVGLAIVALSLAAVNSGSLMVLVASTITLIPNLPPNYIKIFTLGEGSAGIVTSLIQIICLVIGNDSQISGLIYFGAAVVIYSIGFIMYANSRRSRFFRYYVAENKDSNNKPTQMIKPTLADFKLALSEVWPVIVIYGCCIVGQNMNNVSSLVVSENHGDGTPWTEKFFVPVISLLLGNIFGVFGRICALNIIKQSNCYLLVAVNVIIAFVYLPLYIGCNAYPRKIPIFFPHDWQYIIILTTFTFFNGFFTTSAVLSIPNFMSGRVQKEIYYLLLQITLTIIGIGSAPLNIIVVGYIL